MELPSGGKRLPKGVVSALAEEFTVIKTVPSILYKQLKDQLEEGRTLDLTTRKRSCRPSDFTPSKIAKLGEANADNRMLIVRQRSIALH